MNGYSYNGGYDGDTMDQGDDNGGGNIMAMGQDRMAGSGYGGQSLDEIVNQNAKAIRRQSLPHQYGGSPHAMDPRMRRISMMDYSGGSPAGPTGNFQYEPNTPMDQSGIMSGNGTPAQNQHQRSHNNRQPSHSELAVNTSFANASQGYTGMMSNSAYQSPAHPQRGFDMAIESPYLDPGLGIQMDYNVDQNLGSTTGGDMPHMNMYGQPQFHHPMMSSPMPRSGSQGTPHSAQGPSQESGIGSGMNTQYSGHSSSTDNALHLSRRHSLQVQDNVSSPTAHSGSVTPMNQSGSQPSQTQGHMGFQRQPQNPQPGSRQDRGIGNASNAYDGVNGPLPVNAANYNPNNQGFNWEAGEGGWPSTMVGRPHMQTSYKNAYSSTGFDMVGVLVRISGLVGSFQIWLTYRRCELRRDLILRLISALWTCRVRLSYAMLRKMTFPSCTARRILSA